MTSTLIIYVIIWQAVFFLCGRYESRSLDVALNLCLLFSLQLDVATLVSTPHIRSMANQFIQFNTTNNVGENSTTGIVTHMHFCSSPVYSLGYPSSTCAHRLYN